MNQESRIKNIKKNAIIHYSLFPSASLRAGIIRKARGFTLIELLIVVSIIGVLATLLMTNFIGIRQRARDAQRKGDLKQIQSSLELYRADQGNYPTSLSSCGSPLEIGSSIYMQKIPCDPLNSGQYVYAYVSNGTTYSLYSCLENVSDSQRDSSNNSNYCTGGATNWSFTVQNP